MTPVHERRQILRVATEALVRYKLRTALSVLGVVLGVAGVIAMMSVSEGARAEALAQVAGLGLDNLVVRYHPATAGDATGRYAAGLTAGDAEALVEAVPFATFVSPLIERYLPVSYAGRRQVTRAIGVRASYQSIIRMQLARGRRLSVVDDRSGARVCILGSTLSRQLFGYANPIGEWVRVGPDPFEVVGLLKSEGTAVQAAGAMAWRDLDQTAITPLSALQGRSLEIAPMQHVDEIWIQVEDGARASEIGGVLAHTMSILHGGAADVDVVVPRELLAQRYRTQRTFAVVVGSVAALALVVGGIGIMNIMLTSVMERTREIGIRRTVGATRRDITVQFLTESLLMTLGGGAIGIAVGVLVSWAITQYAGWATRVSFEAILLGFGVSFGIGLVFGLYPAIQAARLEPVVALHYE